MPDVLALKRVEGQPLLNAQERIGPAGDSALPHNVGDAPGAVQWLTPQYLPWAVAPTQRPP